MTDSQETRGLRFSWVIFLALGLQVAAVSVVNQISFDLARVLLVGSYFVLVPTLLINIRKPAIVLVLVGLLMNLAAIVANGGSMPIDPATLGADADVVVAQHEYQGYLPFSKDTAVAREDIRLWHLTDVFALPGPYKIAYSLGDLFIVAGIVGYVLAPFVVWRRLRPTLAKPG